jgi:histidine triad (HIT) family protein
VVAGGSGSDGNGGDTAMPTIFTRILDGELPGTFVWRDDICAAFMSINPITRGHALVVPKVEVDHWLDLDLAAMSHLTTVAHVIGQAQQRAFSPARVGLIIAGFEVPHVHVHVLPTNSMADYNFANAARSVDSDDLAAAAEAIRAELRALDRSEVAS